MGLRTTFALMATTAALMLPASAAADVPIADGAFSFGVTSAGGKLFWSLGTGVVVYRGPDGSIVKTDAREDNPVDPSAGFDQDGTTPVVVYTHCDGDGDCRLRKYRLGSPGTTSIASTRRRGCDESSPSIYMGAVAFASVGARRGCDGTFVVAPGGSRIKISSCYWEGTSIGGTGKAWKYVAWGCSDRSVSLAVRHGRRITRRVLAKADWPKGSVKKTFKPTIAGGYVYWIEYVTRRGYFVARRGLGSTAPRERADRPLLPSPEADVQATSLAVDGAAFYYTNGSGLFRADPAYTFTPVAQ